MYRKVLVPLDGSKEAEEVLPIIREVLAPGGEVILLRVVLPLAARAGGEHDVVLDGAMEENERARAKEYLQGVARALVGEAYRWRCEVVLSASIAERVSDVAVREGVDLIAMYTHDRKGLSRLIRGSISEKVRRSVPIEVRVFKPRELAWHSSELKTAQDEKGLKMQALRGVDAFRGLSDEQLERVAELAERIQAPAQEVLGKAGEMGDHLFVVLQGEARLSANSAVGEITVRITGPGESFPLAVLVGLGTVVTSAHALTDMELLRIPRSRLVALCTRNPEIGLRVYANIAEAFASRYSRTLAHLALTAEQALEANLEGR